MWPWGEGSHRALENCSIFNGGWGGSVSAYAFRFPQGRHPVCTRMHVHEHVHTYTHTHARTHTPTSVRPTRPWGQLWPREPELSLQPPKIFTSTTLPVNTRAHRPTLLQRLCMFKKSADLNCLLSGPEQCSLFREINRKEHLQIFI